VHKAQGSESRAVVVALSPSHRPLLTRRLLYTGAPAHLGCRACMHAAPQPPCCHRAQPGIPVHRPLLTHRLLYTGAQRLRPA
jgi:hypothetical protein